MTAPKLVNLQGILAEQTEAEREFCRLFKPHEQLVIFDIGACEGEDSIRYAARFPKASVFAFEPLPENLALIHGQLAFHGSSRVRVVPAALSDRAGQAEFHVSSGRPPHAPSDQDWNYGNKSSSLLAPATTAPMHGWIEFKHTIVVPTRTLDEVCAAENIRRIDFIQMDVQGAEAKVLAGANRMLEHVTAIWLEVSQRENYRDQPLDEDMRRTLRRRGFMLGFECYRGDNSGEGDHLYLNLRRPRTWRYLLTRPLRTRAGRVKRALSSKFL